jgi:hypothetical protein
LVRLRRSHQKKIWLVLLSGGLSRNAGIERAIGARTGPLRDFMYIDGALDVREAGEG